ncbi:MAG: hypothetical protein ACK2UO_14180 [Caldilineaceae bacterium]
MLFHESSPLAANPDAVVVSAADRERLLKLADQVAELAARPMEQEKRELWYRHNALEDGRALVFCDPENSWHEIIPEESLGCDGELARGWEFRLRKEVFWGRQMCDDRVILPYFDVPHVYSVTGWGVDVGFVGGEDGGAYRWDSPIRSDADVERLHRPEIIVDAALTDRVLGAAHDVFDGVLEVRLRTKWWWSLGLTWNLAAWRGLQSLMFDMVDNPELVHRIMRVLCDGVMGTLDRLETGGFLAPNNDGSYVGSGGFGWTTELPDAGADGSVRCRDMWGFAESQETVGISPDMFEEFVFPYQNAILERFGLNCYGCCEPLDARWRVVKRFPRLRRISVSPWANRAFMAEMLGNSYVYSMKPNPSELAMPEFDEERIRAGLRRDLDAARGCVVEVIMKDTHTIHNDPSRVTRWVQIAKEEAERVPA